MRSPEMKTSQLEIPYLTNDLDIGDTISIVPYGVFFDMNGLKISSSPEALGWPLDDWECVLGPCQIAAFIL